MCAKNSERYFKKMQYVFVDTEAAHKIKHIIYHDTTESENLCVYFVVLLIEKKFTYVVFYFSVSNIAHRKHNVVCVARTAF